MKQRTKKNTAKLIKFNLRNKRARNARVQKYIGRNRLDTAMLNKQPVV